MTNTINTQSLKHNFLYTYYIFGLNKLFCIVTTIPFILKFVFTLDFSSWRIYITLIFSEPNILY